ncbi:SIMPL domain-containing protein [Chryseosolibacter indicus]|uniref:SIMPL domain-containing protein n=1 Tax=Chryseosolibacter indicus TaxID=2782351 RepID=A0ABS5VMQ8_9BACT|nr:SIMPL domain-containing protein [Chryseosolibacter indicus]MBT1702134.1 SIMPL domain-containing protein [Chryseosolibacter indicus]
MKIRFLLLAFLIIPFMSIAQNEVFKGEHFIEVTGTAQQEIEPNEIYTTIRLREFEENREKVSLEKLDKDFLNALKDAGIDRKRLELADVGSKLDKLGKKEKDAFREKTYQIKLTSAAELEKLVEKLQSVKIDFVDITRLSHSDLDKIKMDLKIKALQAGKAKAETLLKAIGAEVGKPLMVRDWEIEPVQPMMEYKANVTMRAQSQDEAEPSSAGFRKIKLQAQIVAQFEIK